MLFSSYLPNSSREFANTVPKEQKHESVACFCGLPLLIYYGRIRGKIERTILNPEYFYKSMCYILRHKSAVLSWLSGFIALQIPGISCPAHASVNQLAVRYQKVTAVSS